MVGIAGQLVDSPYNFVNQLPGFVISIVLTGFPVSAQCLPAFSKGREMLAVQMKGQKEVVLRLEELLADRVHRNSERLIMSRYGSRERKGEWCQYFEVPSQQ